MLFNFLRGKMESQNETCNMQHYLTFIELHLEKNVIKNEPVT